MVSFREAVRITEGMNYATEIEGVRAVASETKQVQEAESFVHVAVAGAEGMDLSGPENLVDCIFFFFSSVILLMRGGLGGEEECKRQSVRCQWTCRSNPSDRLPSRNTELHFPIQQKIQYLMLMIFNSKLIDQIK